MLIAQRPQGKTLAGLWEFPGGKVEVDERPEAALIRELARRTRDRAVRGGLPSHRSPSRVLPTQNSTLLYAALYLPALERLRRVAREKPDAEMGISWAICALLYPMPSADAPLDPGAP